MNFKKYWELRKKAFTLVEKTSGNEMRYYSPIKNQPYWTHLMNVHNFLVTKGEKDLEILLASLLHDILEDSDIIKEMLKQEFTERIANIVEVVTKKEGQDIKMFYKIIEIEKDLGTAKIKVADRIDNMLTNYCYSPEATSSNKNLTETKKYLTKLAKKCGYEEDLSNAMKYYKKNIQI